MGNPREKLNFFYRQIQGRGRHICNYCYCNMTQTNDTSINIFMSLVQHVYISCNDYIITFTYTRLLKYLMMTQLKISKPLIYKISHAQRA